MQQDQQDQRDAGHQEQDLQEELHHTLVRRRLLGKITPSGKRMGTQT
jgi:hypothetical protein